MACFLYSLQVSNLIQRAHGMRVRTASNSCKTVHLVKPNNCVYSEVCLPAFEWHDNGLKT
jgi:hypothetical protein